MRTSRLLILCSLAFVAACAPRRRVPAPPSGESASQLQFPEHVGQFKITERHAYAEPGAGVSVDYSDGGPMAIRVYIYPVGEFAGVAPGEAVPSSRALGREVAAFREVLDSGIARGWWDSYEVAYEEDASLAVEGETVPGYLVMTVLRNGSEYSASAFYIFDVHNEFVKIRITAPFDQFRSARPMTDFQGALIRAIAQGNQ